MDEDKPFTVRDRRKFTAEGDLKSEPGEDSTPPAEAPPRPEAAVVTPDSPAAAEPPAAPQSAADPGPADGRVDFAGFLVSLASQASMLLTTDEGDPRENLHGAQHLIAVLEMLDDKTQGRRTPEEDQILKQVLYELRMAFVERSRAGGA